MINFEWMEQAVCSQTDAELFFPEGSSNTVRGKREQARKICAVCPVKAECLEFAMLTPWIHDGVWGGLDAADIRKLARQQAA